MKNICLFICGFLFLIGCDTDHKNHNQDNNNVQKSKKGKGSPKKNVMTTINNNHIHIEYNSPSVRNRIIWGGLVPLGEVWVTGAHNATNISFSEDVIIDNKKVKKGKYAIFTIPNKDKWIVILNKNWKQHLTDDYSDKEDILRTEVIPIKNVFTESLSYSIITENKKEVSVIMAWENLKISISIQTL